MARGRNTPNRIAAALANAAAPAPPLADREWIEKSTTYASGKGGSSRRRATRHKIQRRLRAGHVEGLGWVKIVDQSPSHVQAIVRDAKGEFEVVERIDAAGELHSPGAGIPSRESSRGDKWFHRHGMLHRAGDKPAVELSDGRVEFRSFGVLHRDVAPAVSRPGYLCFYRDGDKHRVDGPAEIWFDEEAGLIRRAEFYFDGRHCAHRTEWEIVKGNAIREG